MESANRESSRPRRQRIGQPTDDERFVPTSGPCRACRATGKVYSNSDGVPHDVTCPWCEGTKRIILDHDAQENPAETPKKKTPKEAEEAAERAQASLSKNKKKKKVKPEPGWKRPSAKKMAEAQKAAKAKEKAEAQKAAGPPKPSARDLTARKLAERRKAATAKKAAPATEKPTDEA